MPEIIFVRSHLLLIVALHPGLAGSAAEGPISVELFLILQPGFRHINPKTYT